MHAAYGGVVPELASRDHIRKTLPMINEALALSHSTQADIDAIAYTAGPGLVGASAGRGQHRQVSGVRLANSSDWHPPHGRAPVGADDERRSTRLSVPGPAGFWRPHATHELPGPRASTSCSASPSTMRQARRSTKSPKCSVYLTPAAPLSRHWRDSGTAGSRFRFPRPMTDRPGLDFSFSGLKTFTMNTLRQLESPTDQDRADIALAFQTAVTETVKIKCRRAVEQTGLTQMVIAGGVSANQALRQSLEVLTRETGCRVYYPELKLCTDNGAMIAYAGLQHLQKGHSEDLAIHVRPRWPMTELG